MALPGFLAPVVKYVMARRQAQAPFARYLTGDEALCFSLRNQLTSAATVGVSLRVLKPDGSVYEMQDRVTVPASSTVTSILFQRVPQGFLLHAAVGGSWPGVVVAGVPIPLGPSQTGQVWAKITIGHGVSAPTYIETATLASGWATVQGPVCYPQGSVASADELPGLLHLVTVASPAAGADFTITGPTSRRRYLRAVHAHFQASAVAGARVLRFRMRDNTGAEFWQDANPTALAAGNAPAVSAAPGLERTDQLARNLITLALPTDAFLHPGWTFEAFTFGLLAGDQWSAINLVVEDVGLFV